MQFGIADTFTDSLARLTGDEPKAVKTTVFDLQMDPVHPSLGFHKLDRAKDKNFWPVRVSSDIRLGVYETERHLLYVVCARPAFADGQRAGLRVSVRHGRIV